MEGGYYRVDLNDKVSVLALNTMYWDSERIPEIKTAPKGKEQMEWFKEQLREAKEEDSDRMFIPISHIYPGARYKEFELWLSEPAEQYFNILKEYKERIIMEISGHDHFSSLRVHKDDDGDYYHNIFVAPSLTPWYSNNPGVTSLKISEDNVPHGLKSTFLNLNATIGKNEPLPYDELEFR